MHVPALAALAALAFLAAWAGAEPAAAQPPSARVAYLIDYVSSTLDLVDLEHGTVELGVLPVGAVPNQVRVAGQQLLVVNSIPENLQVVDLQGMSSDLVELAPGSNPWAVEVVGDRAFVSLWGANQVAVIDLPGLFVRRLIDVGQAPEGMCVAGGRLLVACSGFTGSGYLAGAVTVIDLASEAVVAAVPVARNPQWCATDREGEVAVVCSGLFGASAGQLYVLDALQAAAVDSVAVGGFPGPIAIDSRGRGYMVEWGLGLLVVDTVANLPLHDAADPLPAGGLGALGLAIDAADRVHVALSADGLLSVIEPDGSLGSFYVVGAGPQDVDLYQPAATPVAAAAPPAARALRVAPNPLRRGTGARLTLELPAAGEALVRIVDVAGRSVRHVHRGALAGGRHRLLWDGRNDRGARVAAGVYFAQVIAGGVLRSAKLNLLD